MHPAVRFLLAFCAAVCAALAAAMALNAAVDPFQLGTGLAWPRLVRHKALGEWHVHAMKVAQIHRLRPRALVLGNSRSEIGIDPGHPALRALGPAYNASLPGADMLTIEKVFRHALARQPELRVVVIGLDLVSFWARPAVDRTDERLDAALAAGSARLIALDSAFSARTLWASMRTLADAALAREPRQHHEADGRLVRRNPPGMGTVAAFGRHLREAYLLPWAWYSPDRRVDEAQLAALRAVVETCRQRGIRLELFMSPAHVVQWQALHDSGHWPRFEAWKRAVVAVAPAWDFTGINSVTAERLADDMRFYLESSHYQPQVGHWVLDRQFGRPSSDLPADFGRQLVADTVDRHLVDQREALRRWATANPQTAARVARWRVEAQGH